MSIALKIVIVIWGSLSIVVFGVALENDPETAASWAIGWPFVALAWIIREIIQAVIWTEKTVVEIVRGEE